ncbi:MAG TPA: GIY-YIG nuclease family protein, partial [bacterium]|nr:GIY-YIG nuclease family protein [bacterium]
MINIAKQLKSLPNSHGIYLFYNSKKELLYVGKATSLRSRVRSYFTSPQPPPSKGEGGNQSLSPYEGESWREVSRPIESMIHQVTKIKTIKTDSVLEAIIFEGNYIKKFRPKYNVDWKDDKSWNYLAITNDKFPRLIAVRQHELNSLKHKNIKTLKQKNNKTNYSLPITHYSLLFGPFPSLNTRETIKILHKLFYISRCSPPYQGGALRASEGGGKKSKPCFDYQLGHCLGVCTGEITAQEYRQKVIRPLTEFLNGHKKRLLSSLKKQMA